MLRSRIIPALLIHKGGLIKSCRFSSYKYIGDPINTVRIFNEKQADELVIFDIDVTADGRAPNFELISKIAAESRMPLCYGGGIKTPQQAQQIVDMGIEKVAVSSAALEDPSLLGAMASAVGRQSVVAVVDVLTKKSVFGTSQKVCTHNARRHYNMDPIELAMVYQKAGAGEVIFNSVDRDGAMEGYDLELATQARRALQIPLTLLGGAGSLDDMKKLVSSVGTVGAAAGSLFVFKGRYRAVLISYPSRSQKQEICFHNSEVTERR